jgi:hypothetical protein
VCSDSKTFCNLTQSLARIALHTHTSNYHNTIYWKLKHHHAYSFLVVFFFFVGLKPIGRRQLIPLNPEVLGLAVGSSVLGTEGPPLLLQTFVKVLVWLQVGHVSCTITSPSPASEKFSAMLSVVLIVSDIGLVVGGLPEIQDPCLNTNGHSNRCKGWIK